jgi:succinoglycan biosynthesis protein ExoM
VTAVLPLVAVTVPTFHRPAQLARLLAVVGAQAASTPGIRTTIIVVDNDPAGSAAGAAHAAGALHVIEPARGLAAVRNAALDAATAAGADALVFIDDDEIPDDGWLAALVAPWAAGRADAVSGEVHSVFEEGVDPWIIAGGFFRRVRFAEGVSMQAAPTNNLLLDLTVVGALGLRFDERFAATGGEDIDFTRRAVALGVRIVSAPGARVIDPVAAERTTRAWVLRRAYRVGTTTVAGDVRLRTTRPQRALRRGRWAVVGAARTCMGAARCTWGRLTRNDVHDARGARLAARGFGMLAGALGRTYREYALRDGS